MENQPAYQMMMSFVSWAAEREDIFFFSFFVGNIIARQSYIFSVIDADAAAFSFKSSTRDLSSQYRSPITGLSLYSSVLVICSLEENILVDRHLVIFMAIDILSNFYDTSPNIECLSRQPYK